ncbi:MAG: Wzz/FepE/Etk N-terminal domain-containing protein [Desulfobulbaceae bacterium]|nr:Wzz/FepE/Etk N-terminal domain-containing protein [Desulfobulbaceae bacterium]
MNQDQQNTNSQSGVYCRDDEIDLMDIVDILVRRKWLIFVVTTLATAAAVLYCVVTPKVYEASLFFGPPSDSVVAPLRVCLSHEISGMSGTSGTSEIYAKFVAFLQSTEMRKDVWKELVRQDGVNNRSFAVFRRSISVASPGGRRQTQLESISFKDSDPEYAAKAVALLVKKANAQAVALSVRTIVDLLEYEKNLIISSAMEQRRREIRAEITSLRQIAGIERLARIARLEEDLRIAATAGIVSTGIRSLDGGGQILPPVALGDGVPHYMLGEQILRAELAEVRQRKGNDSDIDKLPQLQAELNLLGNGGGGEATVEANPFLLKASLFDAEIARLRNVQENSDIMRAAAIVLPTFVPTTPVKPQWKQIVALSFVAGLVFSLFAVLS